MLFSRATFIGIDPASSGNKFAYAALDDQRQPLALGEGDLDEVLAFVGGQQQAVVAIHAPPRLNRGLMADPARRQTYALSPDSARWRNLRLAEYELVHRKLPVYQTPAKEKDLKGWMRTSIKLYTRLQSLGFGFFSQDQESPPRALLEYVPQVCYWLWLGHEPFAARSLEGRLQRQLVLYDLGLDIPEPMRFFEEITRHRILQGQLPDDLLYSAGELQALSGALLAWLSVKRPSEIDLLGDPQEGQIMVPAAGRGELA